MKDRKPFELKNTLIIYNIVQVVLSVILVVEVSAFIDNIAGEKHHTATAAAAAIPPFP